MKNDREMQLMNKVKNLKEHMIDLLDSTIWSDANLKESDRLIKLKHFVHKLKEDLPEKFQGTYNHPDEKIQVKWRLAIKKEFDDMTKRGFWREMKKKDIPEGRHCIKSRSVFKIKRNGIFRPRLVACGYSQVTGIDFTESYSPVVNEVTW